MVRTEESEREKNLALFPRSRGPCSRGKLPGTGGLWKAQESRQAGKAGGCLMEKRPRVVVFF